MQKAGRGKRVRSWLNFDVEDGLASIRIYHILEDRRGDLWFCTGEGVSRYDGVAFTAFNQADGLPAGEVFSGHEDDAGVLWFTTRFGVARFDGHQFGAFAPTQDLAANSVLQTAQDETGRQWFATERGLIRLDGNCLTTFTAADGLPDNLVTCLWADRDGVLWCGTARGACTFDGSTFVPIADPALQDRQVTALRRTADGAMWIATFDGLFRLHGSRCHRFGVEEGLAGAQVRALCEDQESSLWIACVGGVSRLERERIVTYTTRDGLPNNKVFAVFQDTTGFLWFGTEGGLSRFDQPYFANFTDEDGLPDIGVMTLMTDRRGCLWVGTWAGAACFRGGRFEVIPETRGLNIWSLVEGDDGHVWIATLNRGAYRWDGHRLNSLAPEFGPSDEPLTSVALALDGALWFGSHQRGPLRYVDEGGGSASPPNGPVDDEVLAIFVDHQGHLWFGTHAGVSHFDGDRVTTYTVADGLPHDSVSRIYQDRSGAMWFATPRGAVRYGGGRFEVFTTEHGLAYDYVLTIFQDRDGVMWFGTYGGGLSRYDGEVFQTLSRSRGLPNNAVQHILQDAQGDIWIGTEGGVTRYRPQKHKPTVTLLDLTADRSYDVSGPITLTDAQRLVVVRFQGRSVTTHADDLLYRYCLGGLHESWQLTREPRVEFQNLPPGDYELRVQVVDQDLNYSDPAVLTLEVIPDPYLKSLTQSLSTTSVTESFVGDSAAVTQVQQLIREVAATDVTVLILGETGTGKGLAARAVHALSPRQQGPFIPVNCGALPEGLVESELFGHERGAFTGALSRKVGKVELASGGTLFLDEIGDLSLHAQAKILHFLQDRRFERVGGAETLEADARLLTATNRDLQRMVKEGTFRQDLYFRLRVYPIRMPPLRERSQDIALLALYFMGRMATHLSKQVSRLAPEALAMLERYSWPGNVRELEHVIQRAVIVCREDTIRPADLSLESDDPEADHNPVADLRLEAIERQHILAVLRKTGWILKGPRGAARLLGLNSSTLRSRMKKLGIERP